MNNKDVRFKFSYLFVPVDLILPSQHSRTTTIAEGFTILLTTIIKGIATVLLVLIPHVFIGSLAITS
jgi:hypothetical protein